MNRNGCSRCPGIRTNVKAALWESVGKVQGRIEASSPEQADSEDSTASTSEARLVPPVASGADLPRLRNALPTSTLADETPMGESGIEISNAKRGNPRKTTSKAPKRGDSMTSAEQKPPTTETDRNPFLYEQVDSLLDEDSDLEGWETGHDLPTRKR
jgi:hypothetical protein